MARASLAGLIIAASMLLSSSASADSAPEQALRLHDEARGLYAEGKYQEAVAKLELAVELDPKAKLLYYNLGLIVEKLGDVDAALGYFRKCLELEYDSGERVQLARVIKRLEGAKRYTVFAHERAKPADDGPRTAPPVAPPPRESPSVTPWVYVTGAAAVTAFGIAAVLASRASALDPGAAPTTGGGSTLLELEHDAEEAHSFAVGADVAIVIGAVATAATITIAIVSASAGDAPAIDDATDDRLSFELSPTQGKLVWRF